MPAAGLAARPAGRSGETRGPVPVPSGAGPAARLGRTVGGRSYGERVIAENALGPAAGPALVPGGPPRPAGPGGPAEPGGLSYPLAGLSQPLTGLEFVIVDVETTGWLPDQASITEIGAVRVAAGRIRSEFCTLVNPGGAIPADITALTGITDAKVSQAPPLAAALPRFLAFARGCVLTAHNAGFDIGFLSAACGACGMPWPAFPVLDTVTLARLVLGAAEVPDCKLRTLADFFGAQTLPCHRALPDATATAEILLAMLRRLAAAGVRTLAELSAA